MTKGVVTMRHELASSASISPKEYLFVGLAIVALLITPSACSAAEKESEIEENESAELGR